MHSFDSALQPRVLQTENALVLTEHGARSDSAAEMVVGDAVALAAADRGPARVAELAFEVAASGVGHVHVTEVVVGVLINFGGPQRTVRMAPAVAAKVKEASGALVVAFRHAEHADPAVVILAVVDALPKNSFL